MINHIKRSILLLPFFMLSITVFSQEANSWLLTRTPDFEINGKGTADEWRKSQWLSIPGRKNNNSQLQTRVKTMYSEKGMYFLFECQDKKITSTMNADFMDLWKEDVFEVFIQTDSSTDAYFEYELSPMNYELPILISNIKGNLTRWIPFHYEEDRKTKHATHVVKEKGTGEMSAWMGEFFIPFELLRPLNNHVPTAGTVWKGNFYRVDHDGTKPLYWTWQETRKSFHDPERFGTLRFE